MPDQKIQTTEDALRAAFESGYAHATTSLFQLIQHKPIFNFSYIGFHTLDDDGAASENTLLRNAPGRLLTTTFSGDVTGKCYLLLTDEAYSLFTHSIPDGKHTDIDLKEEFIKEVINILSASVINGVSKELNLKMFGDVPLLIGRVNGKIEDIIYDDFVEQTEEVYINAAFLSFEDHPAAPCFVWVVDGASLKGLSAL